MRRKSPNLPAGLRGVILLLAAIVAWWTAAQPAVSHASEAVGSRHPQDGPHVDLRFALTADALVAEVSMNLVFLDEILSHPREEADRLALSELRVMEPALLGRMAELCQVRADGRAIAPTLDGLAMNDPDEALLPLFPVSGMRGLRKIRFELRYALAAEGDTKSQTEGQSADRADERAEPASLSIVWLAYPVDILSIYEPKPKLVIAAELVAQGIRNELIFIESEPEQVWHAERGGIEGRLAIVPRPASPPSVGAAPFAALLGLAVGAVVWMFARRASAHRSPRAALGSGALAAFLVGAPAMMVAHARGMRLPMPFAPQSALPSPEEAAAIFEPLHANLYRAFDFVDESAIYDALALSVDGPLLEELYLTIHRSLVMAEEGGALSRVVAVRRRETDIESVGLFDESSAAELDRAAPAAASFLVRCRFEVDGRVTHWGHAHDRTNGYLARYTVVARGDGWRIADVEVIEQTRLDGTEEGPPPAVRPGADGLMDL